MNVDDERLVFSKKNNKIDDDGPVSKKVLKKQKKNLNKTVQAINAKQEFAKNDLSMQNVPEGPQKPKNKKGPDRMIDDIKAILPHHKKETILKVLEKNNFNKQEALDELFNTPEDETSDGLMESFEEVNKKQKKKKKEETKEEQGNNFLNEMYQNLEEEGLQMNPTEFEELFQEITMIIQEEQKNKGVGLVEINEFVDSCVSIKSMMMEGHELYVDENDPIFHKTEEFMYDVIQKNAMLQKKRQQQFPTLGSIGNQSKANKANKNEIVQKNLIEKIQESYKTQKSEEQYFTPSKVPTVNNSSNSSYEGSIYSLNQDYQSHADVLQLSKEYNNMAIENLKFIYFRLLHDINLCKQFLERYYPETRSAVKTGSRKEEPRPVRKISHEAKKRVIDSNYKKYSLEEIRQQLDHLYKLRNMFRITRGKITNVAYRKELERLSCRENPKIEKLCEVARIKLVEEMAQSHPQYVDLHGYREEEIDEVMREIREMIKSEVRKGNSKIQTKRVGSAIYCIVKFMTGKGRHSKYGKSILKPAVVDWSDEQGLKTVLSEDSVDVYFKLN